MIARRLLLFALVVGIAAMHTLGHVSADGGHQTMPSVSASHGAEHHGLPPAADRSGLMAPAHRTTVSAAFDGMDPSAVCLAILGGALLLGLLRRLLGRVDSTARGSDGLGFVSRLAPSLMVSPHRLYVLRL